MSMLVLQDLIGDSRQPCTYLIDISFWPTCVAPINAPLNARADNFIHARSFHPVLYQICNTTARHFSLWIDAINNTKATVVTVASDQAIMEKNNNSVFRKKNIPMLSQEQTALRQRQTYWIPHRQKTSLSRQEYCGNLYFLRYRHTPDRKVSR